MNETVLLLAAPLLLTELVMKIVALLSLRKQKRTRGPKLMWAILIVLFSLFGWIAYFILGREDS